MKQYLLSSCVILLLTAPVSAQTIRYGAGLTTTHGAAELKRPTTSGSLGVALSWELAWGPHALQSRLDYTHFREKSYQESLVETDFSADARGKYRVSSRGLGLEYAYSPAGRLEGWSLIGGLSAIRFEVRGSVDVSGHGPYSGDYTWSLSSKQSSKTEWQPVLGIAYTWNPRWSVRLRAMNLKTSFDDDSELRRLITYQAGVTYWF